MRRQIAFSALPKATRARAGLVCLALALLLAPQARAAVFAVTSTADVVDAAPGDGVCDTGTGACTLRAAVQETNALAGADVINLPAGTYTLTIAGIEDAAAAGDLDVTDAVTISGAGAGATIVDGGTLDRVFDMLGGAGTTLSSMTVRNGSVVDVNGGGIRNVVALTLSAVTVSGNLTNKQGGGIHSMGAGASLALTAVNVSGNTAGKDGGGVFMDKSTATISNSTISGNTAQKGAGMAAKNAVSTLALTAVTFSGNTAKKDGGGLNNDKATLTADRVTFDSNSGQKGGGMNVKAALATLTNVVFRTNTVTKEGGGFRNDKGTVTLDHVTFEANTAGDDGGGLYTKGNGATTTATNITVSGNSATNDGGAHYAKDATTTTFLNVTITGNTATRGGGLFNKDAVVSLKNSIVANSPAGGNCSGAITSTGYNLDSANTCAFAALGDLINTIPLLGPLQNNGGLTETHELLLGSPAIDAATNAGCPGIDQRVYPRPTDGDGDSIATCDIGAYEALSGPDLVVAKTVLTLDDPFNGGANPKAIPGATSLYDITVTNTGFGSVDNDTMLITDPIPTNTALVVVDFDIPNPGPVAFVDGAPSSGLTYTFISLGSGADDVAFSSDGGATYTYTPTDSGDGTDPAVTHLRVNPKGVFGFSMAGNPSFRTLFKVRVQ